MKITLAIILALFVSAIAWGAEGGRALFAKAPTDASGYQDKLIEQLLVVSGMKKTLQHFPEQTASGVMQAVSRSGLTADAYKEMTGMIKAAFPRDSFVNRVSDVLKKNYDEKRYTHLIKIFSEPLAKKMTKLETVELSPEDMQNYISQYPKHPLSPERIKLFQRMDLATQSSELITKMMISSIEAGAKATLDGCPNIIAEIKRSIDKNRPVIENSNRSTMQISFALTYRDASDDDLNEYLRIYEDKDNRWIQGLVQTAIDEQLKWSIEKGAKGLAKYVQAHKPKKTMFAPKCGEGETGMEGAGDETPSSIRKRTGTPSSGI